MTTNFDTRDVCCVALELSKTSWVCAFAAPGVSMFIVIGGAPVLITIVITKRGMIRRLPLHRICFDSSLTDHSAEPADPSVTERVITIMLAEEY